MPVSSSSAQGCRALPQRHASYGSKGFCCLKDCIFQHVFAGQYCCSNIELLLRIATHVTVSSSGYVQSLIARRRSSLTRSVERPHNASFATHYGAVDSGRDTHPCHGQDDSGRQEKSFAEAVYNSLFSYNANIKLVRQPLDRSVRGPLPPSLNRL